MIQQGDIYWLVADAPDTISHPHVVISMQDDAVTLCALTSNLYRISQPGNVLLDKGEANLERSSVVEVGKMRSVGVSQLGAYIGTLSPARCAQIVAGIRFVELWLRR